MLPGHDLSRLPVDAEAIGDDLDPQATLAKTTTELRAFLAGRDQIAFLARTGLHLLHELREGAFSDGAKVGFEQAEAELLQSFALMTRSSPAVPTSPNNMQRAWKLANRNLHAFSRVTAPYPRQDATVEERASGHARIMTLYYRNIFNSEDAKQVLPSLFGLMDRQSQERLGYRLSDVFRALLRMFDIIPMRVEARRENVRKFMDGTASEAEISALRGCSPLLERLWRYADRRFTTTPARASAAFQVSEMGWSDVFTFSRNELRSLFGNSVADALFCLSMSLGDLSEIDPVHLYMGSPIRKRPFIRLSADALFLPLLPMLISFPFEMGEFLIGSDKILNDAYSDARRKYLEDASAQTLNTAMPSATIHRSVCWHDDETNKNWEHDVVATLGNHVFIFEAKSGKVKPASRRGGIDSLRKNFRQLFVEPGQQAARLERLLSRGEIATSLLRSKDGKPIPMDLSRPVIVQSYGICIEHFASMTSSRHYFQELGLIKSGDPWAPILSIGDLRMIAAHLDTEISFFHYLTRRGTIEEVIKFTGDEQDLLSFYLTNGFQIDAKAFKDTQLVFGLADAPVRGLKIGRANRRSSELIGVQLTPFWKGIVNELYRSNNRHRFDIIETILNQHFSALKDIELHARRWRSGGGKSGLLLISNNVGRRTFALGVYLSKKVFSTEAAWRATARQINAGVHGQLEATQCVVLLRARKSPYVTYDAISFFRMNKALD